MGLLDKILKEGKDALNEVLSDENIEKAGKLFDTIKIIVLKYNFIIIYQTKIDYYCLDHN